MVKVKICGLTNLEDALKACEYGADLLGFIFAEASPRLVDAAIVKKITSELPADVAKAGVFKDDSLQRVIDCVLSCGLDHVQLHGAEVPRYCYELKETLRRKKPGVNIIKVFSVEEKIVSAPVDDYMDVDYYLFDTFHPKKAGGTGLKFDWTALEGFKSPKSFFIAGGLTPENVSEAVNIVHPYGVDVVSGVEESPGKKDEKKLKEFIQNAKKA